MVETSRRITFDPRVNRQAYPTPAAAQDAKERAEQMLLEIGRGPDGRLLPPVYREAAYPDEETRRRVQIDTTLGLRAIGRDPEGNRLER